MEYKIFVDQKTGWGYVSISGILYLKDFHQILSEAWNHPEYSQTSSCVWDFTNARTTLQFEQVMDLTSFIIEGKKGKGPTTLAIVAPDDLEYGMGRVFAAFEERCGIKVNVFRSGDLASEWLLEQQDI